MELRDKFNRAVEQWIRHCKKTEVLIDSSSKSIINCDAYREIVAMGKEALPLIREVYDRSAGIHDLPQEKFPIEIGDMSKEEIEDSYKNLPFAIIKGHGLVRLVREIVGNDFSIPEEIRGRISAMEDYTKNWLDKNIGKYIS